MWAHMCEGPRIKLTYLCFFPVLSQDSTTSKGLINIYWIKSIHQLPKASRTSKTTCSLYTQGSEA
jgi:hypothetical protein